MTAVVGGDIAFDHGAVVVMAETGPEDVFVVHVSQRRKRETWADRVARARGAHAGTLDLCRHHWGDLQLGVELFPEKVPPGKSARREVSVAAAGWWVGGWVGGPSGYVEITEWRRAIWPKSLIAATTRQGEDATKDLAVKTCQSLGWGWIFKNAEVKAHWGDIAEAALIARAMLSGVPIL